ncbi:pyocin knob domain-containing protein [Microcoleus sp. B4-C1]|uniref:pyocin knob domain-containing protein n=1 Tax=Microcoleus sp. B4-C1 TaxID=2818660 RepID=UPI002FD1DD9A
MGKLINLNPVNPIADADIPASIARDSEFQAADAVIANKSLSLQPRSAGANIDANTAISGVAAGFKWIDGGGILSNFPGGFTGCLIQFDPLFGENIAGLYMIQFHSSEGKLYFRSQNNGSWSAWRILDL